MKDPAIQTYYDERLVDSIEQEHAKARALAEADGKSLAAMNRPAEDECLTPYLAKHRSRYKGLIQLVDERTQAAVNLPAGRTDADLAKEATADIDREITTIEHALGVKRLDTRSTDSPVSVPLKAIGLLIVTIISFTAESLWTGAAFQLTGETRTRAVIISLGLSIIMALFASSAVWLIQYWRTRWLKVLTGIVAFAIATSVYYTIGTMRADFLAASLGNVNVAINTSPWRFAILNLAMFIALGLLALRFMPSLGEISDHLKCRKGKREIVTLGKKVEALKAERGRLLDQRSAKLELRARIVQFSDALKRRIALMYQETCQAFIEANLLRRSARASQEMYEEVVPLFNDIPQPTKA